MEKRKIEVTTLCYIEKEQSYLLMHRISKKQDVNKDKWIGVGGHLEAGESPEECLLREVKEETGLTLKDWSFRGLLSFATQSGEEELICLYTSESFSGQLAEDCREGKLEWVSWDRLPQLRLWEGDKIFLRMLQEGAPFFSLKLRYDGDLLTEAVLDGKRDLLTERALDEKKGLSAEAVLDGK